MSKTEILSIIKKHCKDCPLKCDESCRLFKFKDGTDPTKEKRVMTEKQLLNLKGYQRLIEKSNLKVADLIGIDED